MTQSKPIPLVGRLAIQLGMLTPGQVDQAVSESTSSGNPRLAQVFLQLGMLDRSQVLKLQKVQKDLIERHRARKAGAQEEPGSLVPGSSQVVEKPASPAGDRSPEAVHAAAGHAARVAAPMTASEVEALHTTPASASNGGAASEVRAPLPVTSAPSPAPDEPVVSVMESASSAPVASARIPEREEPAASVAQPAPSAPVAASPIADGLAPMLELNVPTPGEEDRAKLEEMLGDGVRAGASDVHFHAGGPLKQRVAGEMIVTEDGVDPAFVERIVVSALDAEQRAVLRDRGEIDFCFDLPGIGRFRANAYRQQRGFDAVFRVIPPEPPTLEQLGLPSALEKYTDYHQGMVLITGPAGCGKSSTLAALVNHINEHRDEHILTVEDPIEIIHPSKRCLVNQRHAGHHTASFSRALRGALREDPDIIVIGELRDLETISLAMTAAETGHFVLATLHTANAVRTVNRMIGAFPSNEQDQVRAMLSESLRAVISQRLVPTADGAGRIPALELLVINRAIGNLIRDEKTVQLRSAMQTGKAHGMYLLEQSLNELVAQGKITRDVALSYAEEKKLITAGA
jgi:twitching motility protein PilT